MAKEGTANNLFRFSLLRPPDEPPERGATFSIRRETELAQAVLSEPAEKRAAVVEDAYLPIRSPGEFLAMDHSQAVLEAGQATLLSEATLDAFLNRIGQVDVSTLDDLANDLSDVLLATKYLARIPRKGLRQVSLLYRLVLLIVDVDDWSGVGNEPLRQLVSLPLTIPELLAQEGLVAETAQPEASGGPRIAPAGIADLLVVKQHLLRYQRADIAKTVQIMRGQSSETSTRDLLQTDESLTLDTETTTVVESERETEDRFELKEEVSKTLQRDVRLAGNFSLSAKGPTVEVKAGAEFERKVSETSKSSTATTFAQDVMERSLNRITTTVREQRVSKVTRLYEQTASEKLDNTDGLEHINSTYQFLEKLYENQVFNYGKRQLFDFMIPEPSRFLHQLRAQRETATLSLPDPPVPLDRLEVFGPDSLDEKSLARVLRSYPTSGVVPPPPKSYSVSIASDEHEEGRTRSVAVPPGYVPSRMTVVISAITEGQLALAVTVGEWAAIWRNRGQEPNDLTLTFRGRRFDLDPGVIQVEEEGYTIGKLTLNQFSWFVDFDQLRSDGEDDVWIYGEEERGVFESTLLWINSKHYTTQIEVVLRPSAERMMQWQFETYGQLADAYQQAKLEYDSHVSSLVASRSEHEERSFGTMLDDPPSVNIVAVRTELKKYCLGALGAAGPIQEGQGPEKDGDAGPPPDGIEEGQEIGPLVRFLEQAFEWDQMQYVLYPYFWADAEQWPERYSVDHPDPVFEEFLRSGYARVVVPTRLGFEEAILHYIETGEAWDGSDELPDVGSELYLPIVSEIRAATGAPQDEKAVGDPWESVVPTSLVVLRDEDDLPSWQRSSPDGWDWTENGSENGTDDDPSDLLLTLHVTDSDAELRTADGSIPLVDATTTDDSLLLSGERPTATADPITEILEQMIGAGRFELEVQVVGGKSVDGEPARILSLSEGVSRRNLTIGQVDIDDKTVEYHFRLRRSSQTENGVPAVVMQCERATAPRTMVARFADGVASLTVDGVTTSEPVGGDLKTWDTGFRLLIGDESTSDRGWLGEVRALSIRTDS